MTNACSSCPLMIRRAAILALAVAVPVFASEGFAASPAEPTVQVEISMSAFAPKEITVAPGTQIVWTNHDEMPHTVTSDDRSFASKGLDTDDSFTHAFTVEGDFTYRCVVHPYMVGVVHVRK